MSYFQEKVSEQAMRGSNDTPNPTFAEVVQQRYTRRDVLKSALAGAPALVLGMSWLKPAEARAGIVNGTANGCAPGFTPIDLQTTDDVVVPPDYVSQTLLRWGDPITVTAPDFDINNQTPAAQNGQFGFNCDFLGWFPLANSTALASTRGILAVNHEYTDPTDMIPGYVVGAPTKDQVDIELAAHGMSFVELRRADNGFWSYLKNSRYNRRVTGETLCEITGPAAGNDWMKTAADPTGRWVKGTLNNCAGGKTPWGTVLTCEENFNQYFANRNSVADAAKRANHQRYGLPTGASERRWEKYHDRFDLAKEPNEPFRFGWVVEIDPYNPAFVPKKRTALGRCKHEGATTVIATSGQVVVYSGDDERFDYIYKFVTAGRYNRASRAANFGLLDSGVLYAAKLNADGTGEWLPLVFGHGPLTPANGFHSQGDVLIATRRAADLLGATRMDRPEDVEANPATGVVYALMTNNTNRGVGSNPGVDPANPRARNRHGHVIEMAETGGDFAATTFAWNIFILCGDPANPADGTYFDGENGQITDPAILAQISPISAPDNLTFDCGGNLWIATDGLPRNFNGATTGSYVAPNGNDGVFVTAVEGPERGILKQFMSGPLGSEVCGPEFTPNFTTLFLAIQHPGEDLPLPPAPGGSNWPDRGDNWPRPSVVAIVKTAGDPRIGS